MLQGGCGQVAVKDVVANTQEYMPRNLPVSRHFRLHNAGNGAVRFEQRWAASNGIEGGGMPGPTYQGRG